jgi:1-acyl-sn-glycerol-3-phosphate acyltransferase
MKFIRSVHTAYGFVVFTILFILLFPLLLFPIFFPAQFKWVGIINRWWARGTFTLALIPFRVECKVKLNSRQQYLFCPNHFSYLDIPTMGLNPINAIFVGKNDMEKIPLFGYMYKKLHITVNRASLKSRVNTLLASMKAIDEGKSLVIYPEGGMITKKPPTMVAFKDGAFRAAIEKQIPVVPVTIPNNWIILPDEPTLRLRGGKVKVIFHQPIETKGMTLDHIDSLKETVYSIIDQELKKNLK